MNKEKEKKLKHLIQQSQKKIAEQLEKEIGVKVVITNNPNDIENGSFVPR